MHSKPVRNLSNARLRVLEAVRELGGQHVTITELTEYLGGHPNASRPHLASLAHDGYITVADVPGHGPGRRPRGHSLTEAGQALLNPAVGETVGLAGAFASYLVQNGHGKDDAHEIGRRWGEQRAADLDDATRSHSVDAVVEVLDILGFDPARLAVEEGDALVLRACPLLTSSPGDQEFMCEVHRGLIDGVLRRIGAAEGVKLLPFADENGCRLEMGSTCTSCGHTSSQSSQRIA